MSPTYLLDTHALLWALTDPARLGHQARRVVKDASTKLVVSAVSAWELATKNRLGKLPQADVLISAWSNHLDRLGVDSLTIVDRHAILAGQLDWAHRDPFDRMLAAQSMTEGFTLVTSDPAFTTMAGLRLCW